MAWGRVSETDAEARLDWVLGGAALSLKMPSLVSNFGNGHTRVSRLAVRLSTKGSDKKKEPSGGRWPLDVMERYECRIVKS